MYRTAHNVPLVAVPLLVVVAILGYLAGYHRVAARADAAFGKRPGIASVGNAQLEYPSSWHPVSNAAAVPGLSVSGGVALAPVGAGAQAGLIGGELPAGEPSVLPRAFLSLLRGPPHVEVVNVLGGQAYGYSELSVSGYERTLKLFVIPDQGGSGPTVLACYASAPAAAYMSQCGEIVARFSLAGQTLYDLTPDAGYAHALGGAIGALQRERLALRRRLAAGQATAARKVLATRLADSFARAATALSGVEAPAVAGAAATGLTTALLAGRDAYVTLATATGTQSLRARSAELEQVQKAESGVDAALESFVLLGYKPS